MRQSCNMKIGRVLFLTLCIFLLLGFGLAQTKPTTVTDYYLALPGGVYGIKGTQDSEIHGFEDDFLFYSNERNESQLAIRKYRRSLIKIEDIKNGYLRLESSKWEGWVEVALFKKADGNYLIAISQVECGPGCGGDLLFLTYNKGTWANVTKRVFPSNSSSDEGYFKLPRVGTTIELICGDGSNKTCRNGNALDKFQWNGEDFTKAKMKAT
jgi:hypothetical protein